MKQKIYDIMILILIFVSVGAIALYVKNNLYSQEMAVKRIGGVMYQSKINVEFFEFTSSNLKCVTAVTTNPEQTFATTSLACK